MTQAHTGLRDALAPCPFCGGEAKLARVVIGPLGFRAECTVCKAASEWALSERDAADRWNRRAALDQPQDTGLRDVLQFIYEIAGDGGGYTVNGQMVHADDLLTTLADEHGIANENAGPLWSQIADRMEAPDPALEKAREALAWRTMDSAPKDGRDILMCNAASREVGFWAEDGGYWAWAVIGEPTHWMPLPPPPVLSSLPEKEGERT